ncbi:MAG: iron export ABC transporter permease subunit FetB [Rhizonema sp. PD38]|nr:iron export ABC transporter permease subunit FetB [Rhizonema sp. PD38]
MQDLIKLDLVDLASAVGLMGIAIGLSAWEKLGLELNLALATGRTILQLVVLGYVLDFVFAFDNNPWAVLVMLAVILTISAVGVRNRITQKIPQILPLVWGSIFVSTTLTLIYVNFLIIQRPDRLITEPHRWYEAQYIIPLAGMVLGNAMNAAAIAGERLVSTINASHLEIETHLSLGATPQQAVIQYRKDAIRAGIYPSINQMMIIGMVTLPPIITGQLLSGVNAREAASYQILIMFMIAVTNLLTTVLLTRGLCRVFFNSAAQLIRS